MFKKEKLNKSMLRKLLIAAIIAQLLVLISMAVKRENILANGESVYLRTAPIDPRDPFRGDFVRLQYEFNNIYINDYQGKTNFDKLKKGDVIYAVLNTLDGEVYLPTYYTDVLHKNSLPSGSLFIKGRVDIKRWHASEGRTHIRAKFGVEQFFVQQGKGKEIEKQLGSRDSLQVPAEMEVAIGGDGTAVIRDFRWSKLGIQLRVIRESNQDIKTEDGSRPISPELEVTFQNVSDEPLDLPFLPDDCSFALMETDRNIGIPVLRSNNPNSDRGNNVNTIDAGCDKQNAKSVEVKTLQPSETYVFNIDMEQPRWRIRHDEREWIYISEERLWQRYRLRFQPPEVNGAWRGYIDTPAFTPGGAVD